MVKSAPMYHADGSKATVLQQKRYKGAHHRGARAPAPRREAGRRSDARDLAHVGRVVGRCMVDAVKPINSRLGLPMGFGSRLYPSYNGYNGVGGKGIDKMIDQLIAKHDELPALPTERRLLFFHYGIGGAPELTVDRKHSRTANCFPRGRADSPVYDGCCHDIA